jgi:hypothetical protein
MRIAAVPGLSSKRGELASFRWAWHAFLPWPAAEDQAAPPSWRLLPSTPSRRAYPPTAMGTSETVCHSITPNLTVH